MSENVKVKLENVSKVYPVNQKKSDKVLSVLKFWKQNEGDKFYFALNNVSFEVNAGDSVGLVGLNGAGKSTLSNLLGEVIAPSSGKLTINGKSSLIAISAGLNNELSGETNIRMKCLMHGLTTEQIDERFNDIVEFSELGDFIKQPIKTYSSGMKSRLGFAIAVHTDPDILIVDEALSVGDDTFSNKCILRMKEFQKQGKTIFFVSHSIRQIQNMCNKAIWIHYGEIKAMGDCIPTVGLYARFIKEYNSYSKIKQLEYKQEMSEGQIGDAKSIVLNKDNVSKNALLQMSLLFILFIFALLSQLGIIPLTEFLNHVKSGI
ncbi:ABC transporter ATP-binding protein [Macrococcus capreoli]